MLVLVHSIAFTYFLILFTLAVFSYFIVSELWKQKKHKENSSETIFHFEIGIVHPTATMRSELLNKIVENVKICVFFIISIPFTNPVIVDKSLSMTKIFFASSRNSTKLLLVTP